MTVDCFKQIFLADLTFALPCFEWLPESDWPFCKNMCPDRKVVGTIKNLDFHFLPRNKNDDESNFT